MTDAIVFSMPWPPSANHYRAPNGRGGHILTSRARAYHDLVAMQLKRISRSGAISHPCRVHVVAHPPDRLRRDLMNLEKVSSDSLVRCGVLEDDRWIVSYAIEWGPLIRGGLLVVRIERAADGRW